VPGFTTFILKVAGRCNLNCSYCYMYKLFDQTWTRQPTAMSPMVWQAAARKIHDHLQAALAPEVTIVLHGGEPLLLGKKAMFQLLAELNRALDPATMPAAYYLQTNGTLLDQEWIDICYQFGVEIGISLDGDQATHDRRRVDYLGRGTYERVQRAVQLLQSTERGRDVFGGVLAVIDLESDPVALLHHVLELGIHSIDFLPPDSNHVQYPAGKARFEDTSYGDWLIALFDEYMRLGDPRFSIRTFSELIQSIQNDRTGDASSPAGTAIVVETNGGIHAMDTWKVSAETDLGLNIFEHTFADAIDKELIQLQTAGMDRLCQTCQACPVVQICRGGQQAHRFSQERGFDNPSVYCADWYKLIQHIKQHLVQQAPVDAPVLMCAI
jgi:uncharacterized protein